MQVELVIYGNLPDPCHQLRVAVLSPDADGQILVNAYSVSDPETMCIQVIEPFQTSIPLADLVSGDYSVILNGVEVAEFTIP